VVFLIERGFIVEALEFKEKFDEICTARDHIAESSEDGNLLTAKEIITYLKKILSLFESLNHVSQDLPVIVAVLDKQLYTKGSAQPSVREIKKQIDKKLKNLHEKYEFDILSAKNELEKHQSALKAGRPSGESSQGGGTTAEIESASAKEQVDSSSNKAQEDLIKAINLSEDKLDVINETYALREQMLKQDSDYLDQLNTDNQNAYRKQLTNALDVLMRADTKNSSVKLPFWSSKKTSILSDLLLKCHKSQCVELLLSVHKLDDLFKNSSPTAFHRDLMLNIPRDQLGVVIAESDQRNANQSSCSSSDAASDVAEASSQSKKSGVYQIILSAFDKEIVKLNSSHKETLDSYEDCLKAIQASARQRDFYRFTRNQKSISRQQALEFRDAFCRNIDKLVIKIEAAKQLPSREEARELESLEFVNSDSQPSVLSQHAGRWASLPSNIMRVMLSNEVLTVVGLSVLYTVVDAIPSELPSIPSFRDIFATGSEINAIDEAYSHSDPLGACMGVFD